MRNEKPKYDGLTNFGTWRVNLWLEHDKESDQYWQAAAADSRRGAEHSSLVWDHDMTVDEVAASRLAEQLKEEITQESPLQKPSMYADLLNASLVEVNWFELAQRWLSK